MELSTENIEAIRDKLSSIAPKDVNATADALVRASKVMRVLPETFDSILRVAEEAARHREALAEIATGEGGYGSQALEYKNIARRALGMPEVGKES